LPLEDQPVAIVEEALEDVSVDIVGSTIVSQGAPSATTRLSTPYTVIWVRSVNPINVVLGALVPDMEVPVVPPSHRALR
jgi:hypothetical protein